MAPRQVMLVDLRRWLLQGVCPAADRGGDRTGRVVDRALCRRGDVRPRQDVLERGQRAMALGPSATGLPSLGQQCGRQGPAPGPRLVAADTPVVSLAVALSHGTIPPRTLKSAMKSVRREVEDRQALRGNPADPDRDLSAAVARCFRLRNQGRRSASQVRRGTFT